MKSEQLHILQHSLGCDGHGRSEHRGADEGDGCMGYYRNRYVSAPTEDIRELVALGYLQDRGVHGVTGGDNFYTVTIEGERAMRELSPRPPKVSRGRQRYRNFLHADNGMTFIQWLKVYGHAGRQA